MIRTEENPQLLNKFLDYCLVYQKSPNSVEQYNSDLNSISKIYEISLPWWWLQRTFRN